MTRSLLTRIALSACLFGGAALLAPATVFAGPAKKQARRQKNVDKRQSNQKARIKQGVRSGELTKKEAGKLRKQQRNIKRAENRAKADGKITKREKQQIKRKQDRASRNIARKKHNDRKRPRAR